MERKDRIAALASNPHSTVKSLKMLEAATDEELTALETQAGEIKAASDRQAALEAENTELKAVAAKVTVLEQETATLKAAAAATEVIVAEHKAQEAAEKTAIVAKLKVAQAAFTVDELDAKPIAELRKLASALKVNEEPKHDYSIINPRAAESGTNSFAPPDPWKKATVN